MSSLFLSSAFFSSVFFSSAALLSLADDVELWLSDFCSWVEDEDDDWPEELSEPDEPVEVVVCVDDCWV